MRSLPRLPLGIFRCPARLTGLGLSFASVLLGATIASAQPAAPPIETVRASEIRDHPSTYLRSSVTVEGFVTQYVDEAGATAAFYYLKDYWGGLLRVQTKGQPPLVGQAYRVTGRVVVDHQIADAYLVEEGRAAVAPLTNPGSVATATRDPFPAATWRWLPWLAGVLGGAGMLLWAVARRRGGHAPLASPELGPNANATPTTMIEGKTVRITAPPQGTVKILPGWFEVLGEEGAARQILLFRPKSQGATGEITFGRSPGPMFTHIQLKPTTVSSRQASIRHEGGKVILTNLAPIDSNATRINGRDLGPAESQTLCHEDILEMGEVRLRFHQT